MFRTCTIYILFYTLVSIIQLLPISILMICKKSLYYEMNYHQSCVYLMLINLKEINHDLSFLFVHKTLLLNA